MKSTSFLALLVIASSVIGTAFGVPAAPASGAAPLWPALRVPPGYRAFSLPVGPAMAAGALPGDRCDVFFVFDSPRGPYTDASFQDVLILARGRGSVVLGVNPMEAVYLAAAQARGTPFLTLRAQGDHEMPIFEKKRLAWPQTALWTNGKIFGPPPP